MAFTLPKIFKKKPKPKTKPSYSPQTAQEITQSMFNLALAGPRWIGEQMGKDLDEAFEIGTTGVSLAQLIRHPLKTIKKTARKWTISKWKNEIEAQLVAELVWNPRLEHFVQGGSISSGERDEVLKWVSKPQGYGKDVAFEKLEELRNQGNIGDDAWQGIKLQHQWDEFSRFRRKPGRYLWQKATGKRGKKGIGPLYRFTPQKLVGEKVRKELAKTGLGQAVGAVKGGLGKAAQRIVGTAKKALKKASKFVVKQVGRAAKWVVIKVAGQATWAAISSAIGAAVGSIAPGVGTAIGFVAGPIITKATGWVLKIACLGCGCATLMFAGSMISILIAIFGAFRPPADRGPGTEQLVEVVKTVSPTHIDKGAVAPDTKVSYTITVTNKTDQEITDGTLVDTHNPDDFLISVWANGDWVLGVGTWSDITIPPHDSFSVEPKGFIQNTDIERVVTNTVVFTGTIEGEEVSDTAMASVIVGEPAGQPPFGWPTDRGCITQGPNTTGVDASHQGKEAIDVGASAGEPVYATHDGEVFSTYWDGMGDGGNYVVLLSPEGFKTLYSHLLSINPSLAPDKCPV